MTALGILWFPAGPSLLWITDHKNKDLLLICVMQCVNSALLCVSASLFVFFFSFPHTHTKSLADFYISIEGLIEL